MSFENVPCERSKVKLILKLSSQYFSLFLLSKIGESQVGIWIENGGWDIGQFLLFQLFYLLFYYCSKFEFYLVNGRDWFSLA